MRVRNDDLYGVSEGVGHVLHQCFSRARAHTSPHTITTTFVRLIVVVIPYKTILSFLLLRPGCRARTWSSSLWVLREDGKHHTLMADKELEELKQKFKELVVEKKYNH